MLSHSKDFDATVSRIASVLFLCTGFAIAQNSIGTHAAVAAADTPSSAAPTEPKAPTASISRPSIRPPTPAPTSINTPAATGVRPTPFPATRPGGAVSMSSPSAIATCSMSTSKGRLTPQNSAAAQVRRLLCRLHEYRPRRPAGRQAHPSDPCAYRRPQRQEAAWALLAHLADAGRRSGSSCSFGVEQDQKDSTSRSRAPQGGLTLPDRDYYLEDNPHMAEDPCPVSRLYRSVFKLIGDIRDRRSRSRSVIEIETALAKGSHTPRRAAQP